MRNISKFIIAVSISLLFFLVNTSNVSAQPKKELTQDERIELLEQKLQNVTEELKKMRASIPDEKQDRLSTIEQKLDILAEEMESLKASGPAEDVFLTEMHGHAPGASKVYSVAKGLSIGGYGEINAQIRADDDNTIDALRAIVYVGYKFTDRIFFNSEIEFEHATTGENLDGKDGEVSMEFANLDFLLNQYINLRLGLTLVPVGIVNDIHEPTTFFGALRPDVETQVIPSTWRANGAGIFGELVEGLTYRAFVLSSLDSRGFKADNIRGARSQGSRSKFNDIAFATRLEYEPSPFIKFGSSLYVANTGQNEKVEGKNIDGTFTMYEIDYDFQWRGLESRALFVYSWLDDAELINQNNGLEGMDSVGEEMFGFYVEAGYNLLPIFFDTSHYLAPFIRYEQYDTQREVPAGFERNPANDRKTITYGLSYKPVPKVVLKLDFQDRRNEDDSANNQFNMGIGWVF